jgi:hypothetical protein
MARVHNAVLQRIRCKQTHLNLDGCERMYSMRLADGVCADLAQANASDLAILDQLRQGCHRGLDWSGEVDSVKRISLAESEG